MASPERRRWAVVAAAAVAEEEEEEDRWRRQRTSWSRLGVVPSSSSSIPVSTTVVIYLCPASSSRVFFSSSFWIDICLTLICSYVIVWAWFKICLDGFSLFSEYLWLGFNRFNCYSLNPKNSPFFFYALVFGIFLVDNLICMNVSSKIDIFRNIRGNFHEGWACTLDEHTSRIYAFRNSQALWVGFWMNNSWK